MHLRPASTVEHAAAADLNTTRAASRTKKDDDSSFASLLATASTKKSSTTPGTDVQTASAKRGTEDLPLRKGEKIKPVEGHAYADITNGKRSGLYINTSGNKRHGETFQLVMKKGIEYHIYGSGKDRVVVALKPKKDDDAPVSDAPKTDSPAASAAASRV
jgi:hypothetical protein